MLVVDSIRKCYGDRLVLNNVSLHISENEIYGLIGKNGAGKSTLINILGNIIKPDAGEVFYNGKSTFSMGKTYRKQIGIIPQELALFSKLSVMDNLLYWGGINRMRKSDIYHKGIGFLKQYGIYEFRNEKVQTLSGGMKRYASIIAAIMQKPKILLMDEPTVGIDPSQRINMLDIILQLKNEGCSVIFCTHYLEEAEKVCDRIGILSEGFIKIEGTGDELIRKFGQGEKIIITLKVPNCQLKLNYPGVKIENNQIILISNNSKNELIPLINQLQNYSLEIEKIEIKPSSLEWIFLNQLENTKTVLS